MTTYRFLSPAEEEMIEAALFTNRVRVDSEMISSMMYKGQSTDRLIAVERKGIVIVAVAHHGREPGYWRSRVN
jgi:hypothetical protein